jgi:hypothetical protein
MKTQRHFSASYLSGVASTLAFLLGVWSSPTFAHQPHVVGSQPATKVEKPEISKAFYAELTGKPSHFFFRAESDFDLFLQLLLPAIEDVQRDCRARVFRNGQLIAELKPEAVGWETYHEHFGGDVYLLGPEYRARGKAGDYLVEVTRPGNRGKFILAIGEKEFFGPGEIFHTLGELVEVKRYFGKPDIAVMQSPLYFVPAGLSILAAAGVALALLWRGTAQPQDPDQAPMDS